MDWPQTLTLLGGLAAILFSLFHPFDKRFEQVDKRFELVDKRIDDLRADTTSRLDRIERLLERLLKPELSR
ncbi:hypothetical protein [Methylacidimicrobium tartarophylax]|uniref:Uncharacterized protein n=1 Tax=Methylacidimicrobium tartarophylax TaxID=1041768 RepID=A0A5E6MLB2_9BACT|nr:hypothetical protein [Methylacidimicrobium tartarophylax]VVM06214.1 hypothetical protein MAMT_01056 [Methylacidimicrobium tartarophylax]